MKGQKAESRGQRWSEGFLLSALCLLLSCSSRHTDNRIHVEFWGLGREGEVVAEMVPEFERRNPGIKIDVQQIPWTAAHEKLLTAHVGRSLPDAAQMGNTWIPEFDVIGALEDLGPLLAKSTAVPRSDYFDGIWNTNVVDGALYGIPWYVDTRVIFYRTDIVGKPPLTWSEWVATMERLKKGTTRPGFYPMLMPTNEWPPPVVLAIEKGAPMITEDGRAVFSEPRFVEAIDFYLSFYQNKFAPVVNNSQIANLYQQFADGEFVMFITGPWNVGELRRRLPPEMESRWNTTPMPARDGMPYPGASLAGGSSLVIFEHSQKKEAAWKFIEYLSEPAQQVLFYEKSGDLPARKSAWNAPLLAKDDKIRAFRQQLDRTVVLPRIPEWEQITAAIFEEGEQAARNRYDAKTVARKLDARVNRILEKRRWVIAQK